MLEGSDEGSDGFRCSKGCSEPPTAGEEEATDGSGCGA